MSSSRFFCYQELLVNLSKNLLWVAIVFSAHKTQAPRGHGLPDQRLIVIICVILAGIVWVIPEQLIIVDRLLNADEILNIVKNSLCVIY